eukprot:CAMPEP_0115857174 /NCGR_PEP_ID=MMETSP0287-20121206/15437_1 /TAXON_ID=412157 /ORGANISM="Chrysochromulina rotalis, Strain UIO044" /LENGTH=408 /DNA_ID=CAMNT_0003311381 /DNA_START=17 /DNA_END=1243 /DNA_ORIENTATION=+
MLGFIGAAVLGLRLEASCQDAMDSYCASSCDLRSKGCGWPTLARFSGPDPVSWRCYSPETLDNNNQTYASGDCYCSRDDELQEVLSLCFTDVVTVFASGMSGSSNCYRIPTIVRLEGGTLLAFAEQRINGCDDNGENNIVLRRSSDDGQTWGSIITVAKGSGRPLSNPNPVEVDLGTSKRAILLHFDTMNNPSSSNHGENLQLWSYDEGLTWEHELDLTDAMPSGMAGCMPGPSVGVQSSDGTIFFSCHGFGLNGFLYWSRDLGATWQTSEVLTTLNECSIALLDNESLAMNCRTGGAYREQLTWSPRGELIGSVLQPAGLVDPNCQGSLLAHSGALFLSNDNTTTGRTHMTVKRSDDNGTSWDDGLLVWAGPSAYSQLVGWGDKLGLLFELGVKSTYESIGFRVWDA